MSSGLSALNLLPFLKGIPAENISQIHQIILSNEPEKQKHVSIVSILRASCSCPLFSCKCLEGYGKWIEKGALPPNEVVSALEPAASSLLFQLISERRWNEIPQIFENLKEMPEVNRIAEKWLSSVTDTNKLIEARLSEAKQALLAVNESDSILLARYKKEVILLAAKATEQQNEIDRLNMKITELMAKVKKLEESPPTNKFVENPVMKMYEAQAIAIEKQVEIDRLKMKLDEMATEAKQLKENPSRGKLVDNSLVKMYVTQAIEKQKEIEKLKKEKDELSQRMRTMEISSMSKKTSEKSIYSSPNFVIPGTQMKYPGNVKSPASILKPSNSEDAHNSSNRLDTDFMTLLKEKDRKIAEECLKYNRFDAIRQLIKAKGDSECLKRFERFTWTFFTIVNYKKPW